MEYNEHGLRWKKEVEQNGFSYYDAEIVPAVAKQWIQDHKQLVIKLLIKSLEDIKDSKVFPGFDDDYRFSLGKDRDDSAWHLHSFLGCLEDLRKYTGLNFKDFPEVKKKLNDIGEVLISTLENLVYNHNSLTVNYKKLEGILQYSRYVMRHFVPLEDYIDRFYRVMDFYNSSSFVKTVKTLRARDVVRHRGAYSNLHSRMDDAIRAYKKCSEKFIDVIGHLKGYSYENWD